MNSGKRNSRTLQHSILLMAVAATALGQTLVFTLLPSLGRATGMAEMEVGLIISCSALVFALASPVWGTISESMGRKAVLVIGLTGYSLGTLLFALVFHAGLNGWITGGLLVGGLVISRMLQAAIMAATPAAAAAYTADITTPEQRTQGMGRIGAANNLGTVIGPVSGGILAAITLVFPLYAVSVVTGLMAIGTACFLPASPQIRAKAAPSLLQTLKKGLGAYADPRLRDLLMTGVMLFMSFALIQQTLGFLFQDHFQMSPQAAARTLGITMMAAAITSLSGQIIVVQWLRAPASLLIAMAVPAIGAGAVVLWMAEAQLVMSGAVLLIGLGLGFGMPAIMSLASLRVGHEEQGRVAGLASACPALGFILGPLVGTGLYTLDHRWPYLLVMVLLIPLSWLAWRLVRRSSRS
ncbi:MFS transporter [Alcanivorax nanhaiticus]|uniref:MFS transporter n=1 Tax=Alcanivorax nanhaiticus TaxID=1177154 RepID=A0A095SMI1_9GAMM|nr:MFS transporter [Alcanivorax nanhaiticus]KGD65782.1 MFS transporter [Alcanivorax nanhaiticus]